MSARVEGGRELPAGRLANPLKQPEVAGRRQREGLVIGQRWRPVADEASIARYSSMTNTAQPRSRRSELAGTSVTAQQWVCFEIGVRWWAHRAGRLGHGHTRR